MLFTKISSPAPVADYLAAQLTQLLTAGKHVLWLVAGGSAIEIAVLAGQRLQGTALANLTVTLTDERFGPPGHPNSNWQQLVEAGLALPGARLTPVLNGQTQAATAAAWEAALTEALANADYTLALLGIGPDGHTSGILPNSPAVDASGLVASYDGGAFQRITATPACLRRCDEAVVYAVGKEKRPALDMLIQNIPPATQPAQILKAIPKLIIYNDYKGDTL